MSQFRKVRKSNQLFKSAILLICDCGTYVKEKDKAFGDSSSVATSDKFVVFTQIEKQRSPSRPSPVADQDAYS
jgi:hypothetical protein